MNAHLTISDRGVISLPIALRRELGLRANDQLIAETTPDGLLLRPAVVLPVEDYSTRRLAEFVAGEAELADFFMKRKVGTLKRVAAKKSVQPTTKKKFTHSSKP
jgi:antitoxin PrlF